MGQGYVPRVFGLGTRPCWVCGGSGRVDTLEDVPRRGKQAAKAARKWLRDRGEDDPCREEWEDWEAAETGGLGLAGEDMP
jgi:hypothetical protein